MLTPAELFGRANITAAEQEVLLALRSTIQDIYFDQSNEKYQGAFTGKTKQEIKEMVLNAFKEDINIEVVH